MTDGTHEDEASTVSGGQNERLVMCSVCAGTGRPISGRPCICEGFGTQEAELQGFRGRVLVLESALKKLDKLTYSFDGREKMEKIRSMALDT